MTAHINRRTTFDTSMRRDFDRTVTVIFLMGIVFDGPLTVLLLGVTEHLS